ncbi:unnamed protein product [Moneuplotes crassus]|uniref:Uncharacterized protein n=2 Tax=Euplotes crassus TaxID=5936 RepID=A0AAD1XVG4_EUPCR|nr:unnamed protein product [Moneuplotes crassus]
MDTRFPKDLAQKCVKGGMFYCQHDLHKGYLCESYAIVRAFQVMKNASKFYGTIHLLPVLIFKLKKLRKEPLKVIKGYVKNVAKSCLFLATYMGLLIYGLCIFRRLLGNRPLHVIFAGLWTFPGMFWEAEGRRTEMSHYFLSPFLEGVWMWLKKRGLVADIPNGDVLLFSVTMAIIMYCYQFHQSAIKGTYLSLFKKLWGEV